MGSEAFCGIFSYYIQTWFRHRGIQKAAKLTELDVIIVRKGKKELIECVKFDKSRVWRKGGGRIPKAHAEPRYEPELLHLIEDETAGDPLNVRIWVRKTVR